jgi:predicted HicB family RNase H-like nuclease
MEAFHSKPLNDCALEKKEPNKPFSGQFLVRGNPELHRALVITAKKSGKSLNCFVTEKLASALS